MPSQFTDFAENKLADFIRGQALTLPPNWYIAPGSAGSDSGITEITGAGIGRAAVSSTLANWAGTQSAGSTTASSGTSHATSNNVAIVFGTPTGSATMTHVGFLDASTGGNCWIWVPVQPVTLSAGSPSPVQILPGALTLTLGVAGGMTDYLANKLIDLLFRGQTFAWPASTWQGAFTAAPSNAGGGTEVGGGMGYARLALTSSLTDLSGTQAAGSTAASSGTAGRISNNAARAFPDPSGAWGDIGWSGFFDAASAGNLLWQAPLASIKTIGVGRPLTFQPDAIGFSFA